MHSEASALSQAQTFQKQGGIGFMPKPKKGERTPGSGRAKGTPNRVTRDLREVVAELANNNIQNVQEWLTRTSKKDPARALDLYLRLLEYYIPKLARSEVSGPAGEALMAPVIIVPRKDPPGLNATLRIEKSQDRTIKHVT